MRESCNDVDGEVKKHPMLPGGGWLGVLASPNRAGQASDVLPSIAVFSLPRRHRPAQEWIMFAHGRAQHFHIPHVAHLKLFLPKTVPPFFFTVILTTTVLYDIWSQVVNHREGGAPRQWSNPLPPTIPPTTKSNWKQTDMPELTL